MIAEVGTAFVAGAVLGTFAVGTWAALKLAEARNAIEVLSASRDRNVDALIRERTARLDAETRLSNVRAAWSRGGRNAAAKQRAAVIGTANKIRASHGMDLIGISPADEAAPKEGGSGGEPRLARGNQSGGTS